MMFEDLVVKNLNVQISAKYHIDDTTLFLNDIENFSFKFENFPERESDV